MKNRQTGFYWAISKYDSEYIVYYDESLCYSLHNSIFNDRNNEWVSWYF